jgi:hypothetical protein
MGTRDRNDEGQGIGFIQLLEWQSLLVHLGLAILILRPLGPIHVVGIHLFVLALLILRELLPFQTFL